MFLVNLISVFKPKPALEASLSPSLRSILNGKDPFVELRKEIKALMNLMTLVGVTKVKEEIDKKGLVKTGVGRASIYAEQKRFKVIITSHKDYMKYLDRGVKPHSMVGHVGKTIPFVERGGKLEFAGRGSKYYNASDVFFRKVTAGSIASGSWYHPGIQAHNFFEEGLKLCLEEIGQVYPMFQINLRMFRK